MKKMITRDIIVHARIKNKNTTDIIIIRVRIIKKKKNPSE